MIRLLQSPRFANTAIVGGHLSLPTLLNAITPSLEMRITIIAPDSHGWPGHFRRDHKLGQSVGTLTGSGGNDYYAKQKMTVDQLLRDWGDQTMKAVMRYPDQALDYAEGQVQSMKKLSPGNLVLTLTNGQQLGFNRAIFLTGVGPERSLSDSGITFLNRPIGPRLAFDETPTALKAITQAEKYFKDQNVLVLGGGATAAWVVELAIAFGVKNIRWVAPRGFDGANPGGRNSEVMELTKDTRTKANLKTVKFLGDLSYGSGLEAVLTDVETNKQDIWKPDRIVAATGANPLAPTGTMAVLGSEYHQIVPMHFGAGFFGRNTDGDVIVSSTSLSGDLRKFGDDFTRVLRNLPPEAQVEAGLLTARFSAEAIGKFTNIQDESGSTDMDPTKKT